jgi:hypothetical protein
MSASLIQGLELAALSDHPSESTHLALIQFLATRQLLQNLSDLRALKANHRVETPRIPSALVSKISTLGFPDELEAEQSAGLNEPALREALSQMVSSQIGHFQRFSSASLVNGITEILFEDPYRDDEELPLVREKLLGAFVEAEAQQSGSAVSDAITGSGLPLGSLPDSEVARSLSQWIASARAESVLDTLIELMADGTLELSQDERARILELVDRRKEAFAASLSQSTLASWIKSARAQVQQNEYSRKRAQFIRALVESSLELGRKLKEGSDELKVDPATLARSLSSFMAGLEPRETVRDWVLRISEQESWAGARDIYSQILAEQAGGDVLVHGLVSPERVKTFLRTHDFSPEIQFSDRLAPALARKLKERVAEGRRKDLRDLLAIGEKMGFHRDFAAEDETPSLNEILGWRDRFRYRSMLKTELLSRYPILNLSVAVPLDHPIFRGKLYQALAALAPRGKVEGSVLARATPLVDHALSRIEAQLRKNLITVGNATDLEDIQKVVTGSVMLGLVMNGFPEFQLEQERFTHELLSPSLASQILRRYAGKYLGWGFGSLMLLEGSKFVLKRTAPYVGAITAGLEPWIQGYMHTAAVVMLAETSEELYELKQARTQREQADAFSMTSADGQPLIDFVEQQSADSAYTWAKWSFLGRTAMDGAFMYYPMLRPVLRRTIERYGMAHVRELGGDLSAFRDLGLQAGDWRKLDSALARARAGHPAPGKTEADAERAYQRLAAKLGSGESWSTAELSQLGVARRPALSSLENALRSAGARR